MTLCGRGHRATDDSLRDLGGRQGRSPPEVDASVSPLSAKWEARPSAPPPATGRLRGAELCGKRAAATPTDAAPAPQGTRRRLGAASGPACVPGPGVPAGARTAAGFPAQLRARSRPLAPTQLPEQGREPRPPRPTSPALPSLTETPGRAAGRDAQAVPRAPSPRVRASAGRLWSRGRLGHGPALSGPEPGRRRRRRRRAAPRRPDPYPGLRGRCPPGPAFPARARGRRGPACSGRSETGGRAGGRRPEQGARRWASPGRLRPGRELGPGPRHRPARARPLQRPAGCDPRLGPGPGCGCAAVPAPLQQGSCCSSCHVDTNCILGGMSLSGRLKKHSEARRRLQEPRQLHLQPVGANSVRRAAGRRRTRPEPGASPSRAARAEPLPGLPPPRPPWAAPSPPGLTWGPRLAGHPTGRDPGGGGGGGITARGREATCWGLEAAVSSGSVLPSRRVPPGSSQTQNPGRSLFKNLRLTKGSRSPSHQRKKKSPEFM